jgi:flavin prenyltransferase
LVLMAVVKCINTSEFTKTKATKLEIARGSSLKTLPETRVVLAVTGASGSLYAEALLIRLLRAQVRTYLVFSGTGAQVVNTEVHHGLLPTLTKSPVKRRLEEQKEVCQAAQSKGLENSHLQHLRLFDTSDLYAPIASGSEGATHMVVCPASMGTVARIAHGISANLLERAADVMLKERRPLVVVPRETPFSLIHLKNLTALAEAGAHVVPAMPAFYMQPKTIDELVGFMVERIFDTLGIADEKTQKRVRWNVGQL